MELSRRAIQRMILRKSGDTMVISQGSEGGGGVTLGPLLTSLNAEAMPTAEGYLHWTGSDWDFTSIDLSSYATEAWVVQQGYVTSSAISDMATETWVLQQGYITESAVSNAWKVKDVEIVDDNSLVTNGEDVIYGAVLASNGMLTLNRTRLSIYVPEYTSDLVNDSGFIDQTTADGRYLQLATGGTVNGNLNVKGTIQAQDSNGNNKVIIYGTTGNIRAEKVYIGGSTSGYEAATHDWVTSQGYQANVIETVKVAGTALNPTNKAVDIPAATSDGSTFGVVAIGTGFTFDEDRLCVDTSTFATRTWADGRYLPLTAGSSKPLTGDLWLNGNLVAGNPNNTTNDDSAKIAFYTNKNYPNISPYIQAIYENNYGRKRLSVFQKNVADWDTPQVEVFTIKPNGNVGIGTTSPAEKLDVAGNVKAYGATLTNLLSWNVANTDNLVISNNKIQLSISGTPHNIVLFEGSTASLTSYAKFYERPMVKTGMNNGTPVYTNVALVSEVEAKQNIIHFFNTKGSNAEVFFSNIYLPLNYQGGGTVYLDLSDYATTSALSGYLPLTAGSSKPLTGNIAYKGTKATYDMITFIDNVGDIYGNGIAIGGGGATIIGGGESAGTMSAQVSGGSEVMYIGNDQGVSIFTNLQNGWDYRKEFTFHNTGVLSTAGSVVTPNGSGLYIEDTGGTERMAVFVNNSNQFFVGFGMRNAGYEGYFDSNIMYLRSGASGATMTLDASHNVGIGTTAPAAKLDVNGSVKIAGSLTGATTISTSSGIFAGGNIETKGSFVWCDSQNFSLTIMEGLAVSGDVNYCCALFRHKPQVQLGSDMLEVVVAKSDENGIEFRGSEDGTYTFGYGSGRGDIYAGSGDFSGNLTVGNRPSDANQKLYVGGSAVITGNVGIGTRPTGTYAVEVDGSVYATSFVNGSDIRMKDVTSFIEPSVHDIAIAPIIEFVWKKGDGSKNLGTIAQYWQAVFPQAVHEGSDGMMSIEYANIALASAITAARKAVDNERRIAELELRVAELEDELAAMVSQQSETTGN